MPDTACLHIQGRDSDPIRVVELPGVSVRIGRASYCEVRLPEADLAEEECQLRRRGSTWHLVPVASPCAITIDGQAVEHSRPLPFGLALRVGAHSLTLRPAGASPPEWSQDDAPTAVAVPTALALVPAVVYPPASADPEALSRTQSRREGLLRSSPKEKRWEARWKAAGEKLRASAPAAPSRPAVAEPPRAPQRPEDWADAELPRREVVSAPTSPVARHDTSGFPSVKTVARPPQYPSVENVAPRLGAAPFAPNEPGSAAPRPPTQPSPTKGEGLMAPSPLVGEGWGGGLAPLSAGAVRKGNPAPPPKYPPLKPVEPPAARVPFVAHEAVRSEPLARSPVVPTARWSGPRSEGVGLGARSVGGYTPPAPPHVESRHVPPLAAPTEEPLDPLERAEQLFAARTLGSARSIPRPARRSEPVPEPAEAPVAPEPVIAPESAAPEIVVLLEEIVTAPPIAETVEEPAAPSGTVLREDEASAEPIHPAPIVNGSAGTSPSQEPENRPIAEPGPFDTHMSVTDAGDRFAAGSAISHSTAALSLPVAPTKQLMALAPATPGALSAREWPAARDILAAHQSRPRSKPESAAKPASRRRKPRPVPTAVCEPEHWKIPLWLGLLPLTLVTLVVGMGGFKLAREWSNDARIGGIIANHLAVSEPGSKFPLKPEEIPSVPWWKSTAGNLAQLGVALGRTGDPVLQREGETLLRVATQASPFQPSARFALAHLPGRDEEAPAQAQSLGLSRDVVALAWAGNRLLKDGKKDAALRTYRSALEMAATAEVARLAVPVYNDDPQVRRYTLPGESLIGQVVREMADQSEWTYAEWSKALPRFAVAPLVAARLLQDSDRTSAEAALDSIVAQGDQPAPPGTSVALHCAAQAEAFALKSEWTRAEALYRQAIDQMPSPKVRRAWWVNVADIDLRLNDETARQKALEAANSHDPNDEITQRVVEIQKFSGYRADKASPRARTAAKSADKS